MDFPLFRLHNFQSYLVLVQVYCHAASHERQELISKVYGLHQSEYWTKSYAGYINPKECQTQSWNHSQLLHPLYQHL